MVVLHPVARNLTSIFRLQVLRSVLFFSGRALGLTMKDLHSFGNSYFLTHFFENYFTFQICYEVGSKSFLLKLLLLICSSVFPLPITFMYWICYLFLNSNNKLIFRVIHIPFIQYLFFRFANITFLFFS